MDDQQERWQHVGDAIAARIEELGLTQAEFLRRSKLSDKTLGRYLSGKPIVRKDKKRELCRALGWTPDSVDLILAGGVPRILPSAWEDPAGGELVELLQQRLDDLEDGLTVLRRQVREDRRQMNSRFRLMLEAMGLEWGDVLPGPADAAAVTKGPNASLDQLDELIDELEAEVSPDPSTAAPPERGDRSAGQ